MKYRKLRIAFSAACGIVCLLLIALWVRSYWYVASMSKLDSQNWVMAFASSKGQIRFTHMVWFGGGSWPGWHYRKNRIDSTTSNPHFELELWWFGRIIGMPHWLLAATAAALAAAPWIQRLRWRFSLRTLLIVTMLVAVVMGIIVAAT
jgi:hypothetical protein